MAWSPSLVEARTLFFFASGRSETRTRCRLLRPSVARTPRSVFRIWDPSQPCSQRFHYCLWRLLLGVERYSRCSQFSQTKRLNSLKPQTTIFQYPQMLKLWSNCFPFLFSFDNLTNCCKKEREKCESSSVQQSVNTKKLWSGFRSILPCADSDLPLQISSKGEKVTSDSVYFFCVFKWNLKVQSLVMP